MTHERGLTLLEVMVALVVLSLVMLGYLQVFHGSHDLVRASEQWSEAVAYGEDAMERVGFRDPGLHPASAESLPGGFRREMTWRPWQPGLALVRVTVTLPGGGRFELDRLVEEGPLRPPSTLVPSSSPAEGPR